jgi:rfaE bifunctional protein kinase chain/domain
MQTLQHMTDRRLQELLEPFPRLRVAVIGDFFLDKYFDVDPQLAETSLETGKTAHQIVAIRHSPGAAGTVVCNLAALGAGTLHAIGFTGDDGQGYELRHGLEALGCRTTHLHCASDRMTPTYMKPRDMGDVSLAGEHERYDIKNRRPTSEGTQAQLLASLEALLPEVDAVIALDQVDEDECGVITSQVRERLARRAAAAGHKTVFWADSRRRIGRFRNVIIKPNQFEAVGRENPAPDDRVELNDLAAALPRLRERNNAPVFVTRGPAGILVSDPEPTGVPGIAVQGPIDPTGAGDSVTAGAVLALAAGATAAEAALVGNLVASITVKQLATTGTAGPQQLPPQLQRWREQRAQEGPS